jgi:hypothetical protein
MQRSLGYDLVSRFTIGKEPFPMPDDEDAWNRTALFQGSNPQQPISYAQLHASVLAAFLAVGISVAKKTHAFRVAGAQRLDARGVDDMVSAFPSVRVKQVECHDIHWPWNSSHAPSPAAAA